MARYTTEGGRSSKMRGEYADGGAAPDDRQKNYEAGIRKLKYIDYFGLPSIHKDAQRRQSERISDAVPRRKEDEQ